MVWYGTVWYGMIFPSFLPWHGRLFSCLRYLSLFYHVPYSSYFFLGPVLNFLAMVLLCWCCCSVFLLRLHVALFHFFFFFFFSFFLFLLLSFPCPCPCCLGFCSCNLCVLMRLLSGWPCVLAEVAGLLSLLALFACLRDCFAFLALSCCRARFAVPALPCQAYK